MKNNEVIDHPNYYRLPDGHDLEDVIAPMPFDVASAVKYMFRAGRKDGEAEEKDVHKAWHYVKVAERRTGFERARVWLDVADCLEYCGKPDRAEAARGFARLCGHFAEFKPAAVKRRLPRWPEALVLLAAVVLAALRYDGAAVALVLTAVLVEIVLVVVGRDDRTGGPSR